MKKTLIAIAVLSLTGCGTFSTAGKAAYTVNEGERGWNFTAEDGKDINGRKIMFNAMTGVLVVEEGASVASTGQAMSVEALKSLGSIFSWD
jgi:hypothetical protein